MKLTKKENEERLELYYRGYTDRQIAEKLNFSTAAIYHWRRSRKLEANDQSRKTEYKGHEKEIKKLYDEGLTDYQIATTIGIKINSVKRYRWNNKLISKHTTYRGKKRNER